MCWFISLKKKKRLGSRIFSQGYEQTDWGKRIPNHQQLAEGVRKATAVCGRYSETDQMKINFYANNHLGIRHTVIILECTQGSTEKRKFQQLQIF